MAGAIVAVTGHRPSKFVVEGHSGYDVRNPLVIAVQHQIEAQLRAIGLGAEEDVICISGMALGVDQWFAQIALNEGYKLIAAVPFRGQDSVWPPSSKREYQALLARAHEVVEVCEPGYTAWKMQKRNEWMVDKCTHLIAVYDGSSGGTRNCVNYATSKKTIHLISPQTLRIALSL
jgi:uncharacterized phage-like protein YoqJ